MHRRDVTNAPEFVVLTNRISQQALLLEAVSAELDSTRQKVGRQGGWLGERVVRVGLVAGCSALLRPWPCRACHQQSPMAGLLTSHAPGLCCCACCVGLAGCRRLSLRHWSGPRLRLQRLPSTRRR